MDKFICCICGKECMGYGNNPEPVKPFESGVCCDDCNMNVVILKRMKLIYNK